MIRTFTVNAATGLFACLLTGAGSALIKMGTRSLPTIAMRVGQIGIGLLAYVASRSVQTHIQSDFGAIIAGMEAGFIAEAFADQALKVTLCSTIITGTMGCILNR